MSGAKLVVKHALGVNSSIRNGLIFFDDRFLAYVCGHQIVIYNTESKDQTFISLTALTGFQSMGITAVACAYRKKLIAIAEKTDSVATVSFYDASTGRKRKVLTNLDLGSKEIRSIAFTDDCKLCLTLGAGPEWNLILWNVDKTPKLVSTAKLSNSDEVPMHHVSFCPWDQALILVIGKLAIKVFRITDGQLRPVTLSFRRENANFISHCWLEEDQKLIIGTETGEILLLENLEFRGTVYPTGNELPEEVKPAVSIVATSKGFAIGTTNGEIKFFERVPNVKDSFQVENSLQIPKEYSGCSEPSGNVIITGLVAGTDDYIICTTNTQQILTFSPNQLQAIKNKEAKEGSGLEFLMTSFHSPNSQGESMITGIDVAMWKPLVVTCGLDKTVRLWNTNDRRLEIVKELDDVPTCLSVDPTGLYITVGFTSKICMFSVLIDSLELTGTISCRSCTALKYSSGGQFIAALNGSNIQVYNALLGSLICCLRGHLGAVRSFVWQNLDSRLMSVGADGTMLVWDIFPQKRRPEHYTGQVGETFATGTGFKDGSKAFVCNRSGKLKEIICTRSIDTACVETVVVTESEELDFGIPFDHICLDDSRKMIMLCTSDISLPGSILCVLTTPHLENRYDIQTIHTGPISAICQSHDGMTVFTGDVNGCLCISEVSIEPGGGKRAPRTHDNGVAFRFEDEVLVHRADVEKIKAEIRDITSLTSELTLSYEHHMRLKESEHLEAVKRSSLMYTTQLESDDKSFYELVREKVEMEAMYANRVEEVVKKNAVEVQAMIVKSKAKIATEEKRHEVLKKVTLEADIRWGVENKSITENHDRCIIDLEAAHDENLKQELCAKEEAKLSEATYQSKFEASRLKTEMEADTEIDTIRAIQEEKVQREEEVRIDVMAQHTLLRSDMQALQKKAQDQEGEIKKLRDKEVKLTDHMKSVEKEINGFKKEIRIREDAISEKEVRISSLKKKNQELEKFKYVLDFDIKELKLQIAPREEEIEMKRKQIEDMNVELEQYLKSHTSLLLMINGLKLKLEGLRRELLDLKDRSSMLTRTQDTIKRELEKLWILVDQPSKLKECFLRIYHIYAQEDPRTKSGIKRVGLSSEDPQLAYNRDREMLEKSLENLRKTSKTESASNKRESTKMNRERCSLISELNALRRDAGELRMQQQTIESAGQITPKMDNEVLTETLTLLGVNLSRRNSSALPKGAVALKGSKSLRLTQGSARGKISEIGRETDILDWHDLMVQYSSCVGHKDWGQGQGQGGRKSVKSLHRTLGLRSTSSAGRLDSMSICSKENMTTTLRGRKLSSHNEAVRELKMQDEQMMQCEERLRSLCSHLNISAEQILNKIGADLYSLA